MHAGNQPNAGVFYLGNDIKHDRDLKKCMRRAQKNFLNKIVGSSVLEKKRNALEEDFNKYGAGTAFTLSMYLRYKCFVRYLSQYQSDQYYK